MISEKRSARRFSGRIGIVTTDEDGLNFGFITDLSRHGAYVESEKVPRIGSSFAFVISNGTSRAGVVARVMRTNDTFFQGGRSGFGIHFEQLQGLSRVVRDDLLLSLMAKRFHAKWETH